MGRKSALEKDVQLQLSNITEEIRKVSQLGKAINNSGLKKRTIIVLLAEITRVRRCDIELILNNLPLLEREFLK